MRRLLIAAAIILSLGLLASGAFQLASARLEEGVRARLEARGVTVDVDGVRLRWRHVDIPSVCFTETNEEAEIGVCATDTRVSGRLLGVLRGRAQIEGVRVESVTIIASGELGSYRGIVDHLAGKFAADREPHGVPDGSAAELPRRGEGPRLSDVPQITIGRIDLSLNADQPFGRSYLSEVRVGPDGDRLAFSATLPGSTYEGPGGVRVRISEEARLTGSVADSETWTASLEGSEGGSGVTVATPDGPVDFAFSGLTVVAPRTLQVRGARVQGTLGPSFSAEEMELELREFTTSIEDLYFARARLVGPALTIPVNEAGRLVMSPTRANAGAEGSGEGEAAAEGSGDPAQPAAPGELPTEGPALWADREWWEKLPQQITIERGSLSFAFPSEEVLSLTIDDIEVEYALRAIRTQMDLEASAAVVLASDTPGGTLEIEAVWNWAEQSLDASVDMTDIAIEGIASLVPWLRGFEPDGRVDLALHFVEQPDGSIPTFTGRIEADMVGAQLPNVTSRIISEKFIYAWSATRTADDPTRALRFQSGEGQVANMQFSLTPTIHGFDYESPYLGDGVDVVLSVPDQNAMALLYSIPAALLGPLRFASLDGTWGFDLAFPITWGDPDPETGRRPIDIGASTRYEVRDSSLHLVELPPDFDVRRLNERMPFVFRGPPETPERALTIPPPAGGSASAAPDAGDGAPAESWARLQDISYFLIAATLYREDGRFFRNHGINWYQLRAVLQEAWQEARLGRGASTISMQTVKNVFLSHERSIERKVQELFLTYWMTRLVPKERILEVYLNIIEWGPGINGVVEAAEYYFGKSPAQLSLAESVWLSSIVPAPVRRSAQRSAGQPADWSMRHCRDIMQGMHSRGWITSAELGKGLTADVRFVTAEPRAGEQPPREVDWQALGLDDLRVTSDIGAPAAVGEQLGLSVPPQQRIQQLISTQIPLRP